MDTSLPVPRVFVLLLNVAIIGSIQTMVSPARLTNQRVLITGGGRGIGRALALICNREGAKVAIMSRTKTELEETARAAAAECLSGGNVHPIDTHVADVMDVSQVENVVKAIVEKWDGIDILINNAGGSQ